MAIALFWGIAVTTWHGSHIRVDVLQKLLRPIGRRRLERLVDAIMLAFLAPMAWMVWSKVAGQRHAVDHRSAHPVDLVHRPGRLRRHRGGRLALLRLTGLRHATPSDQPAQAPAGPGASSHTVDPGRDGP